MKQEKITRTRRKELKRRLMTIIKSKMKFVYLSGLLSWVQFMMRIVAFNDLAYLFYQLYLGENIVISQHILLLVGCMLLGFIGAQLSKKYQGIASEFARNYIKTEFFNAFKLRQGEFDDLSSSDILLVASQGIDSLDTFYHMYLSIRIRAYLNCATILILVAMFFPMGSLIFIASLPLIPISIVLMQKRSQKIMQHYWATYMDVGNLFMENLSGLNTLYHYHADERYENLFLKKAEEFRQSTMTLLRFQLQAVGYMDTVMYVGVSLSGFYAVQALASGQLNLYHMIFFILIATEFFMPVRELGYSMHLLMMNIKMADKIFTFLDDCLDNSKTDENTPLVKLNVETIQWEDVSFSYANKTIIKDLQLINKKGELFAIAGESGSGKTTLSKILLKKLVDYRGTIRLDGFDLSRLLHKDIYEHITSVSLSSQLVDGTIMDNLQMGNMKNPDDILKWLKHKNLLQFVENLPERYETKVGLGGQLLSNGQRQQIIVARAMLANRDVYIFDEVTSSVDIDNEEIIFNSIKHLAKDKIVLFISHKMKQVNQAERVLFLGKDNFEIASPEHLYTTNEEYKNLVDTQKQLEEIFNHD